MVSQPDKRKRIQQNISMCNSSYKLRSTEDNTITRGNLVAWWTKMGERVGQFFRCPKMNILRYLKDCDIPMFIKLLSMLASRLFGGRHIFLQLLTYLASLLNQRQHTSVLLILFAIICSSSIVVNDCLSSSTCPIKKEIFSKPYLYIREIYSWSTSWEKIEGTCSQSTPVLFRTTTWMFFSSRSFDLYGDIKLLDKLIVLRAGNCSQIVPTSCKEINWKEKKANGKYPQSITNKIVGHTK